MNDIEKHKEEIQNRRLINFAEHLSTIKKFPGELLQEVELVDVKEKIRCHYKIMYSYFVIDELPGIFEDFDFDLITGDPMLKGRTSSEEGPTLSVLDFFGLASPAEFAHLFDMEGLQDTSIYGGRILNGESTPADVAFNIMQFVRYRKFKFQPKLGK